MVESLNLYVETANDVANIRSFRSFSIGAIVWPQMAKNGSKGDSLKNIKKSRRTAATGPPWSWLGIRSGTDKRGSPSAGRASFPSSRALSYILAGCWYEIIFGIFF